MPIQQSQGIMTETLICPTRREVNNPNSPKLLNEVHKVLRLHHYSIHTERSYVEWIV